MEAKVTKEYVDGSVDLVLTELSREDLEAFIKMGIVYTLKQAVENHKEFLDPACREEVQ